MRGLYYSLPCSYKGALGGVCRYLAERFDIDFIALTFTQDGADVRAAREALAEAGLYETKILAKARQLTMVQLLRYQLAGIL